MTEEQYRQEEIKFVKMGFNSLFSGIFALIIIRVADNTFFEIVGYAVLALAIISLILVQYLFILNDRIYKLRK